MLETIEFLHQRVDLGGLGLGEFEEERLVVIGRFTVHRLAIFLERHLHVCRGAARKGFAIEEPLRILRKERAGEQQNQRPLHTHLSGQPAAGSFVRGMADGDGERVRRI